MDRTWRVLLIRRGADYLWEAYTLDAPFSNCGAAPAVALANLRQSVARYVERKAGPLEFATLGEARLAALMDELPPNSSTVTVSITV